LAQDPSTRVESRPSNEVQGRGERLSGGLLLKRRRYVSPSLERLPDISEYINIFFLLSNFVYVAHRFVRL
jgi:hypothetical protein